MMPLYADGSFTTINDTIRVFYLSSPPNVTGIMVAPTGETKSPVNPVKVDVRVATFFRVMVIFPMKATIPPFVTHLQCLDLASKAEKSLDCDDEWSRVGRRGGARSDGKGPRIRLGRSATGVVELRSGAFIAIVTEYQHLKPLFSLLLTIPLHIAMPSVVLAARRAPAAEGCRHSRLTCVSVSQADIVPDYRVHISLTKPFGTGDDSDRHEAVPPSQPFTLMVSV
ncbi:hypothetical protein B296_00029980 [Ensete ventricosum]|uniref:Uncharacterized protein n=1 Tax=Ensete ventricosum TaxID=4639 RepID=A0A426YEX1_ENSVE|nr:hypothetical protein B296_00029980 [Ensete ventricosum]